MKNFVNALDNHTYFWVPVVCFVVFLLIGITIGLLKGGKRALYYLVWDVIALILAVCATEPLLRAALKDVDSSSVPVDLKKFFFDHHALMPIAMIAWFIVLKPIATLVQIPFRKHLAIGDLDKTSSRLIGATISMVATIPVTVLSANAFTLISGENIFSKASDKLTYGITFGQYEGISKDVTDLKNVLKVGSDKKLQNHITDIVGGTSDLSQMTEEDHKTIEELLNGNSIQLVVKNASGSLLEKLNEGATTPIQENPQPDANKFEVKQSSIDELSKTLKDQYNWSDDSIKNLIDSYVKPI